jgi:UDP-N-acetylglucosamine 1-carboxyvinyltransferase
VRCTWTLYPAAVERIRVVGGERLAGEVRVAGAKNSMLKVMAAALLAEGTTRLTNVPDIDDLPVMAEVLGRVGARVSGEAPTIDIAVPAELGHVADYASARRIRHICVLGPLLARCGRAQVALPGGDAIGSRALDLHIAGLERLGASLRIEHGYLVAEAGQLAGAQVWLDFPSVGATENVLMAAVLAKGSTVVENAAREPEIGDLCRMLLGMGAKIDGIGSSTLQIEGVDELHPTRHDVVPDRVVAGTYAYAAVLSRGDITIRGARPEHLEIALDKLGRAGAQVDEGGDGFRVRCDRRPRAVDVVTLPYPGFPTDLQPLAIALAAVSEGSAFVTENLFEGRFMFIDELVRLGADVRTDGHHAVVRGKERLSGAPVRATDIRAGAGLVLAGLVAEGETMVSDIHHIDRGYPGFVECLRELGGDIRREGGERAD